MTDPDTPAPSSTSGDAWWTPLAPDGGATPPDDKGPWWTPLAEGEAHEAPEVVEVPANTEPEPETEPDSVEAAAASWDDLDDGPEPEPEPEPEPVVQAEPAVVPVDGAGWSDDETGDDDDGDLVTPDEPESRGSKSSRAIVEWVGVIVGALVVALVVKTFLFQAFYIPSESMEPTLEKGDRVLVNKLSYDLHDVHRGDVIVFELDKDEVAPDGIKDLIKRVVGLPGDTIETRDGAVYIDDRKLDEPYLPKGTLTGDPSSGTNPEIVRQVVPDGHVYVLGDNRDNSADSRYANRGPIAIDHIVGRAFVLVWPPQDMSGL